ncbi:hypothetical protein FOCC_FOCC007297 [Frankliniella occidentalis]|nr:hypothetical protein FOCC_FOCC007297 [Frankliniella occidentalis]
MPSPAYGTFHDLKKGMPAPADKDLVVKNSYCPQNKCRVPISFKENERIKQCECQFVCDKKLLDKSQSYFLSLSLIKQLQSLLKEGRVLQSLRWEERDQSDVISGQFYQSCIANDIIRVGLDLTIQFNTDGAAIFSTSTVSVWPLQVMINELPYNLRADSIVLCGLWYGSKPNMNTFLKPFIDELSTLHRHGFELPGDPPRLIKVHAILCSVDTVARAPLQALHYHRGHSSCSFYLHPGEEVPVGRGSARAMRGDLYPARSKEMDVRDTAAYNEILPRPPRFHINGVTGTARLLLLPIFNIIESFVPDSLLLGVVKTFTEYWCPQANNPFYIGAEGTVSEIDCVLNRLVKLPDYLGHLLVDINGGVMSGRTGFFIILFPVNFPDKYLNHWFLLVYSMSCFLSDHVTPEKYEKGTRALRKFVLTTEQVYGSPVLMKCNTHLLLHYPKSVKDFGALWAWSTLKYEHYNGFLGKMFKSSQSAQLQICKNYVRLQGIREQTFQVLQDINCPASVKKVLGDTGRMT